MRRRSNLLVGLGVVSFVLGLLAVYLITSDGDDAAGADTPDTVEVLVAAQPLQAGALGEDILRDQLYRVEEVPIAQRQADALVTPSQLSGAALTLSFTEGEQIRTSGLRTVGGARAQIPAGFEAVSVSVDYVAGGANTIIPGDRVNVFLVGAAPGGADDGEAAAPAGPRAELLLTNTLVLDVQQGTAPLQVSQPADPSAAAPAGGGQLIVVLALNTVDAEKVIFATEAGGTQLYFSRVRVDDQNNPAPPVEATPGVDGATVLAEEPGAGFRRSNG
jgi:Flp pilus assembly protein CpaB